MAKKGSGVFLFLTPDPFYAPTPFTPCPLPITRCVQLRGLHRQFALLSFLPFHANRKPPQINAAAPEPKQQQPVGQKYPELDRIGEKRPVVEAFNEIRTSVVDRQDLPGREIDLDFPAILALDFRDAISGSHVDAIDV